MAYNRYEQFKKETRDSSVVFLELGVGANTPGIIKYPFQDMTMQNSQATYAVLNLDQYICNYRIEKKSIYIKDDIGVILKHLQ